MRNALTIYHVSGRKIVGAIKYQARLGQPLLENHLINLCTYAKDFDLRIQAL